MRGGRQTDQQQPRVRVAKPWYRFRPIGLVAKRAAFFTADPLTVLTQPRTLVAGDDLFANLEEIHVLVSVSSVLVLVDTRYHTRHALLLTIGASALQANAFWNSGMFASTPFTR
jgi:hypothetical protein